MHPRSFLPAAAVLLAACGADAPADEAPGVDVASAAIPAAPAGAEVCRSDGTLHPLPDDVHESSGVAASRTHAGIYWTHNDSGDPEIFAIDGEGNAVGRVRVAGAEMEDWEDLSLAPCPGGGDCLYVADVGDNEAERDFVTVYRVPEPDPADAESRPATAIRARYPDGPHDAEAVFVLDGAVHVVTKGETGPIALYRIPEGGEGDAPVEMVRLRALSDGEVGRDERITGAGASPDGRWIAVRTLRDVAFHGAGELVSEGGGEPRRMDLRGLGEAQGEGVAFAADGSVVLTSESENRDGSATLARLECALE